MEINKKNVFNKAFFNKLIYETADVKIPDFREEKNKIGSFFPPSDMKFSKNTFNTTTISWLTDSSHRNHAIIAFNTKIETNKKTVNSA
jgi:hypothetical protein